MSRLLTILLITFLMGLTACSGQAPKKQCPYLKAKESCSKGCDKSCKMAAEYKKKSCSADNSMGKKSCSGCSSCSGK